MQAPLARLGLDWAKKRLTIHCSNSQDTGVDWREVPFKSKRTGGGQEQSLFRSHKQHPRRDLTVAPLPSIFLLLPKPKKKKKDPSLSDIQHMYLKDCQAFWFSGRWNFSLFMQPHAAHRAKEGSKTQRCLASWLRLPATNGRPGTMSYLLFSAVPILAFQCLLFTLNFPLMLSIFGFLREHYLHSSPR